LSITDSLLTASFFSIIVVFFSSVSFEVSITLRISSSFSLFSFCLPTTTVSLSGIFKESSELGVSARITSLGTYAAKIIIKSFTKYYLGNRVVHLYIIVSSLKNSISIKKI